MEYSEYVKVLTIAGSDSSGGAGVQADIKTMSSLGIYAASAITAVTVQNTKGVTAVHTIPPDIIEGQIRSVMCDLQPSHVKIGMLADTQSMVSVANVLKDYPEAKVILDPVMVATSGDRLMEDDALQCLRKMLLPASFMLTPNIPEAEALAGMTIREADDIDRAAVRICEYGTSWVLVKGGHLKGATKEDRLYYRGLLRRTYTSNTVDTPNTHGTGCTLSSAVAAWLARGCDVEEAVEKAKDYVYKAIEAGANFRTGMGHGPVNHFHAPLQLCTKPKRETT